MRAFVVRLIHPLCLSSYLRCSFDTANSSPRSTPPCFPSPPRSPPPFTSSSSYSFCHTVGNLYAQLGQYTAARSAFSTAIGRLGSDPENAENARKIHAKQAALERRIIESGLSLDEALVANGEKGAKHEGGASETEEAEGRQGELSKPRGEENRACKEAGASEGEGEEKRMDGLAVKRKTGIDKESSIVSAGEQ